MASLVSVVGKDKVIARMRTANKTLAMNIERGLGEGGKHLFKKSQVLVPVQIGNLKASGTIRRKGRGFYTDIIVIYTSGYAVYVHENLQVVHGQAFNVSHSSEIAAAIGTKRGTAQGGMFERGDMQQAKFLERPARTERLPILKIIHSISGVKL